MTFLYQNRVKIREGKPMTFSFDGRGVLNDERLLLRRKKPEKAMETQDIAQSSAFVRWPKR